MKQSFADFMQNRLRMRRTLMARMGDISIQKVFAAPGSKYQDEVVVVFADQEVRDAVKRAAKELAGDTGVGMRLEIPRGLQPSLKALESVSYALKQRNKEMRRNIRFDDEAMDLVLDFNTNPDGNGSWKRIRPDQARKFKSKTGNSATSEVRDDELNDMLGGSTP